MRAATSPRPTLFCCVPNSCKSDRETSIYCHSTQQLSPPAPQPCCPWHPKLLCVHSGLVFRPSGCQELGLNKTEKVNVRRNNYFVKQHEHLGTPLKKTYIQLCIMQSYTIPLSIQLHWLNGRWGSRKEFGSFFLLVKIFPAVIFFPLKSLILPRGNLIFNSRVSRIKAEKDFQRKSYLFFSCIFTASIMSRC